MSVRGILTILMVLGLAGSAAAGGVVAGHVVWHDRDMAGVAVHAYPSIAAIGSGTPVASSAPSAADGRYRLALPAGSYYLVARSGSGPLAPGELFGYFSGGAVSVREGKTIDIGFNLIRIPADAAAQPSAATVLRGEITFAGRPLRQVYLYLYRDAADGFRGPGYLVQPVADGRFNLRLPPGDYYLIARKRARGGQYGPIEAGDYFGYYAANPLHVAAGTTRTVTLETVVRRTNSEAGAKPAFRGVRGVVRDGRGGPAAGLRVFAYRQAVMSGTPDAVSAPTGADGRFELPLRGDGPFYLLARESFGGPVGSGERSGVFGAAGESQPLTLPAGDNLREVEIRVAPLARP